MPAINSVKRFAVVETSRIILQKLLSIIMLHMYEKSDLQMRGACPNPALLVVDLLKTEKRYIYINICFSPKM